MFGLAFICLGLHAFICAHMHLFETPQLHKKITNKIIKMLFISADYDHFDCGKKTNYSEVKVNSKITNTVVPATAGPLGERPPALAGHFCDVPTTLPC